MSGFEQIVRPVETRDVTPGVPISVAAASAAPANVSLSFGGNGSGKVSNGSLNYNRTKYMDKKPREIFGHGSQISFQFPPFSFP